MRSICALLTMVDGLLARSLAVLWRVCLSVRLSRSIGVSKSLNERPNASPVLVLALAGLGASSVEGRRVEGLAGADSSSGR